MAMDIVWKSAYQRIMTRDWCKLLDLAIRHGWKPAGLLIPDPMCEHLSDWFWEQASANGSPPPGYPGARPWAREEPDVAFYTWNDGNVVTADDARSLADALELALQDPPMLNTRQDDPAAGWFSDDNKASMLTFIALCRSGCFVIC